LITVTLILTFAPSVRGQPRNPSDTDTTPNVRATSSTVEVLRRIKNPLTDTLTIPIENFLEVGDTGAVGNTLQLRAVAPLRVTSDWLLILRPIGPLVVSGPEPAEGHSGIGDVELGLYASPARVYPELVWGVGPIVLAPTGGNDLGEDKWAAGPTAALIWQRRGWTLVTIAHHVWSFAGDGPESISVTLVDPWLVKAWRSGFGVRIESEIERDWHASQWTIPIELGVTQLVRLGRTSVDLGLSGEYFLERVEEEARWGIVFATNWEFGG
jgi:hypothetical protein